LRNAACEKQTDGRKICGAISTNTHLKTIAGLEDFACLEFISLSDVADDDLQPLFALPRLKEVYLDEALLHTAEDHLNQAAFHIVYQ